MKRILFIILLFLISATASLAFVQNKTAIDNGLNYLRTQQKSDGQIDGFSGVPDWASMAFSASNIDTALVATTGGQSLDSYLRSTPPTLSNSSTDWSRRILTVTAANQNPYDYSEVNLVSGLKTYYKDSQIGNLTTINDDVFGLLALIASRESTSSAIITDATSYIISHQHGDGSFSYSSDPLINGDIDDTASSVIALIAVKNQGVVISNLQTAIDKAKEYLLSHQNTDGGFAYDPDSATSWDTTSNVSSTAWVMMALSALGMNDDTVLINAQNYLLSTQQTDGSFPYQPIYPPGDTFDTSYAITALEGVFWPIHIFSGIIPSVIPIIAPTNTPSPTPTISITTPTLTPILTPTPTVAQSTSYNNPTPTITSAPTIIISKSMQKITIKNKDEIPSPSIAQILGVQNKIKTDKQRTNNNVPFMSIIFFGLGIVSLILYKSVKL